MKSEIKQGTKKSRTYLLGMILYDIFAVNFAFWFAMIARFFIAFEFRAGAEKYISTLARISPFYTVIAIAVFYAFKLYNTPWMAAGIRDINRILWANIVTALIFVVGSLATGNRMPLTIYFIGPAFQLLLVGGLRLGIKLVLLERDQKRRRHLDGINVMIVGIQDIGQMAKRQIDCSDTMVVKCLIDTEDGTKGRIIDGIPVAGLNEISEAAEKYGISYVMIADSFLGEGERAGIRRFCREKQIDVADMTGYVRNGADALSPVSLLQAVHGKVTISVNGKERTFADGEQAMMEITQRYLVRDISGSDLRITLGNNPLIRNDTSEEWVTEYRKETGNDVSFF